MRPERYASWDVSGIGEDGGRRRAVLSGAPGPTAATSRHALAEQLARRLRPLVAGAQRGLGDEAFLEHLAAAKARTNDR